MEQILNLRWRAHSENQIEGKMPSLREMMPVSGVGHWSGGVPPSP